MSSEDDDGKLREETRRREKKVIETKEEDDDGDISFPYRETETRRAFVWSSSWIRWFVPVIRRL